jgi:hypothetical protein
MPYIKIGLSTYCPNTPQNRREFEQFCDLIASPRSAKGPGSSLLSRQIGRENKKLRALRSHLPGYEPDRW